VRTPPGDEPPASRVRPFLLTGGRAARDGDLLPEAQVVARWVDPQLRFERRAIAQLASTPLSIAEIAARLHLHLGVVRVLVSQMHASGHLDVLVAPVDAHRDVDVLERVIHGLRSLG
jgi:hypothetical protein